MLLIIVGLAITQAHGKESQVDTYFLGNYVDIGNVTRRHWWVNISVVI